ncbi:MAG: SPOR domain-containing protein [Gammaproteobacteria bacterium]|nr:SPOR domain-containing protein [Gammaproteobacteria bacterium]
MARDYKHSSARNKPKQPERLRPQGSWVSFMSGLGLGLVVAVGVYVWRDHMPRAKEEMKVAVEPPAAAPKAPAPAREERAPEPERAPPPERDFQAADVPPKPTFDFYKILPEVEVKVPETELQESAPPPPKPPKAESTAAAVAPAQAVAPAEKAGAYIIQVGSYQKFEEADRAKASLALQGIRASIHQVVINGQDVWYRVHLGPYTRKEDARVMRQKVLDAGANAIVLKISDNGPP